MAVTEKERAELMIALIVAMAQDGDQNFLYVNSIRTTALEDRIGVLKKLDTDAYSAIQDRLNSTVPNQLAAKESLRQLHASFKKAFYAMGIDDPTWDDSNCPPQETLGIIVG